MRCFTNKRLYLEGLNANSILNPEFIKFEKDCSKVKMGQAVLHYPPIQLLSQAIPIPFPREFNSKFNSFTKGIQFPSLISFLR